MALHQCHLTISETNQEATGDLTRCTIERYWIRAESQGLFLERVVGIDGHESELLKGEGGGVGLGLLLVITGHGRLIGLSVHDDLERKGSHG